MKYAFYPDMVQFSPEYKNSIITFMKIDEKEWDRLLRNNRVER